MLKWIVIDTNSIKRKIYTSISALFFVIVIMIMSSWSTLSVHRWKNNNSIDTWPSQAKGNRLAFGEDWMIELLFILNAFTNTRITTTSIATTTAAYKWWTRIITHLLFLWYSLLYSIGHSLVRFTLGELNIFYIWNFHSILFAQAMFKTNGMLFGMARYWQRKR